MQLKKYCIAGYQLFVFLILTLPFIYGCNGGGGSGAAPLSGLQKNEAPLLLSETVPSLPPPGNMILPPPGETLARVHNPEPATLLLLGSGMVFFRSLRKKK